MDAATSAVSQNGIINSLATTKVSSTSNLVINAKTYAIDEYTRPLINKYLSLFSNLHLKNVWIQQQQKKLII